ncbi:MAG: TetR family transcriptional regulator [Actinomycetota bacterium]
MLAQERYPISELVERAGIPAATIHHYRKRGLLPAPRRVAANRFLYDERHVQALRLIRLLRERRRLSLPMIRRILPDLLGLEEDQAFRPEMWDEAVGTHLSRGARRTPRARLLDAATEIFARRGYADVHVDEICKAARIAKGSFYRHYRSKEELFFAAAKAAAAQILVELGHAVAPGPVPHERAAQELARLLEPRLPVFMELFTRAVQRRPGYPAVSRRMFTELAVGVGEKLGAADPLWSGAQVLLLATVEVFRRALEPSPLAALGAPPAAGT